MRKRKPNKIVEQQYIDQGSVCLYCNDLTPYEDITRDHFHPKSKGNTFVANKVFCCLRCNCDKDIMDIYEFHAFTLERIREILRKCIEQGWKISEEQLSTFRYLTRRLKATGKIIEGGGQPSILFT